jgi:hypothetical protein
MYMTPKMAALREFIRRMEPPRHAKPWANFRDMIVFRLLVRGIVANENCEHMPKQQANSGPRWIIADIARSGRRSMCFVTPER